MTIKDLAAQTGYSVGTVSRVLNHQPHVSEQAREIILRAAEESGFQLNSNAKQLKQQHGTSILAICKSHQNMLFDELLVSIQARIARSVHPLVVDYIDETENEVQRAVQLCREKKPLGVLFLGGNQENFRKEFHKIDQPCVLVTSSAAELSFDKSLQRVLRRCAGCQMATGIWLELRASKDRWIGGSRQTSDAARLRYQGCGGDSASMALGLMRSWTMRNFPFYLFGWLPWAQALLKGTGVTAPCLLMFRPVMAIASPFGRLNDAGKRSEDVSVMGLDGLTIGEYTAPL